MNNENRSDDFETTLSKLHKKLIKYAPQYADGRPNTRIFHDLGLRGDDAQEFLIEIFHDYGVDPAGFNFRRYFKGEYFSPVDIMNSLLGREDKTKRELTVEHLAKVCLARKWFDPQ